MTQAGDGPVVKKIQPKQLSYKNPDNINMYYVYILKSLSTPNKFYIGKTNNLKRRLKEHNNGDSIETNRFKPWAIKNYFAFIEEFKASNFEKYLKTSRGRRFTKQHF